MYKTAWGCGGKPHNDTDTAGCDLLFAYVPSPNEISQTISFLNPGKKYRQIMDRLRENGQKSHLRPWSPLCCQPPRSHIPRKTSLYSVPETHTFSSKADTRQGTEKGQCNTLWPLLCPEAAGSANTHAPFLRNVEWPLGGGGRSGVQPRTTFPSCPCTQARSWDRSPPMECEHIPLQGGGPFQARLLWKPGCPPYPFFLLLPALSWGSQAQQHSGTLEDPGRSLVSVH